MSIDKPIVIVTGAARGLGLAISAALVSRNYFVIGIGRTLTKEFSDFGSGAARFVEFDLANTSDIPSLVNNLSREFGPIYGLINNAASGKDGVLATMHSTDIDYLLRLNLYSPMMMTKCVVRNMLPRKTGVVVNISSIIASTGFSGLSIYGATKAGLEGFTRSLAREVGKAGITVNSVAPGYMKTDMTSSLAGEKLLSVERRAPLGLAEPADAAEAVAFLLSQAAKKITGTVLTVDGGSTA